MTRLDVLAYEVNSSFFASLIWWEWGQDIASRYFAWKVKTKYNRYYNAMLRKDRLDEV